MFFIMLIILYYYNFIKYLNKIIWVQKIYKIENCKKSEAVLLNWFKGLFMLKTLKSHRKYILRTRENLELKSLQILKFRFIQNLSAFLI